MWLVFNEKFMNVAINEIELLKFEGSHYSKSDTIHIIIQINRPKLV